MDRTRQEFGMPLDRNGAERAEIAHDERQTLLEVPTVAAESRRRPAVVEVEGRDAQPPYRRAVTGTHDASVTREDEVYGS